MVFDKPQAIERLSLKEKIKKRQTKSGEAIVYDKSWVNVVVEISTLGGKFLTRKKSKINK